MTVPFNRLTRKEAELFALLAEECGETIQAIGKILRHGLQSTHPDGGPTNLQSLERELGDVCAAMSLLADAGVINRAGIERAADAKIVAVGPYLHHWNDPT